MRKTYKGSCHCGLIRFECDLELGERTSKCNCSICTKSRFWKAIARAEAFRLVQEADALTDYQFGGRTIHHQFCSRCGVKPFGRGTWTSPAASPTRSTSPAWTTPAPMISSAVRYENGRNDRWDASPAETRHL